MGRHQRFNTAVLEAFIVRYKDTFYAELARARIDDLKKQQVASPPPKREQPTTVTGTLRYESYSVRSDCELDAFCSWAEISKQCQRKSGSLATAMLDASPIAKAPSPSSCDGVEAFVSNGESMPEAEELPLRIVLIAPRWLWCRRAAS